MGAGILNLNGKGGINSLLKYSLFAMEFLIKDKFLRGLDNGYFTVKISLKFV